MKEEDWEKILLLCRSEKKAPVLLFFKPGSGGYWGLVDLMTQIGEAVYLNCDTEEIINRVCKNCGWVHPLDRVFLITVDGLKLGTHRLLAPESLVDAQILTRPFTALQQLLGRMAVVSDLQKERLGNPDLDQAFRYHEQGYKPRFFVSPKVLLIYEALKYYIWYQEQPTGQPFVLKI